MTRAKAVGIRQLKAHLSRELQRVKAGATVAVTERGRVIATIQPAGEAASPEREWAGAMVASGRASWAGGKPSGLQPSECETPEASLSDAVLEDRR